MKIKNIYNNFELTEKIKSPEIDSDIFVFEHKKLGTELIFIKNKDKEKAFTLSLKTPSPNSKGYQHILEHSVLRSSEKYDFGNKEVFTDILKKSSLTFLNAATYDDKTIYPFSTMLESEFFKVMDIYTDAVFNPLCVKNKNYFRQEGWRWDKDSSGKYFINGVVFNEMKGRLSSQEVFAWGKMMEQMFPDTEYKHNAGGDPEEIPDLKYEDFVKYHKKYYHPSNAIFLVYGDLDILKVTKKIDQDFLSKFENEKRAEKTKKQKVGKNEIRKSYFFPSGETSKNSTITISFLANDSKNIQEVFINNFLMSILKDTNSDIYKSIIGSGLVSNFFGEYDDTGLQSLFTFFFEGLEEKDFVKVENIFFESLEKVIKDKINKKTINSKLNKFEYSIFAKNFTNGKGLKIIEKILINLLHENSFLESFQNKKNITFLKKEIKSGGLEKRLKKYLLKNTGKVVLSFIPKKDFDPYKKLTRKIDKINSTKDKKVLKKIDEDILEFKKYQEEKTLENVADLIKNVNQKSFPKKVPESKVKVSQKEDVTTFFQKIPIENISKYGFLFNANFIDKEDIQYASFIASVLPELAPKNKNRENFLEILSENVVSLSISFDVFKDYEEKLKLKLFLNLSFLTKKEDKVFESISDLLRNISFDKKTITQSIEKQMVDFKNNLAFNGREFATNRANSKISQKSAVMEKTDGFDYYFFLKKIKKEVTNDFEKFEKKMELVSSKIFVKNKLVVLSTANKSNEKIYQKLDLKDIKSKENIFNFKLDKKNEGVVFESLENSFNAISAKIKNKKDIYKTNMLSTFLSYGFLWEKVREEGGAYGCRFSASENESIFNIFSHMDSRVLGTFKDYEKMGNFLREKDFSDSEIESIVSQTLSKNIEPKNIFGENLLQFQKSILKIDNKKENTILDEKKSLTKKDIKRLSMEIEKAIKDSVKVSVGPENKIMKDKDIFDEIIVID